MAIIGNNSKLNLLTMNANTCYAHNKSNLWLPVVAGNLQKVTKFYVYDSGINLGSICQVGIFDVTNGVEGSTQVGQTFSFTSTAGSKWQEIILTAGEQFVLPVGIYNIQIWSDNAQFATGLSGNWQSQHMLRYDNAGGLQPTFNTNKSSYSYSVSVYAETIDDVVQTVPVIDEVSFGEPLVDGTLGDLVTGNGFLDPQGSGVFVLSPTDDVNHVDAMVQQITQWQNDNFNFNVNLPVGAVENGLVYGFVTNSAGEINATGFAIDVLTVAEQSALHTLVITDATKTKSVLCYSPSGDFALGVIAIKYPAGNINTPEVSLSVVALSSLASAQPQFNVVFNTGPPDDAAGDTIAFVYDQNGGDIVSVKGNKPFPSGTYPGTTCV